MICPNLDLVGMELVDSRIRYQGNQCGLMAGRLEANLIGRWPVSLIPDQGVGGTKREDFVRQTRRIANI